MKIDTFNSSQPASVDLPTSDKNTSGVTGPVITSKSTWTVKNDARSQANDSRNSTSYGLNSTQTSPAKSRVTRAEEEPVLMAGEPWADFQERHYRWRLGIPRSEHVDRKLIPENEGTIPPRSVQEALFEGFIGFVLGGPGAGVRPGAPTLGPKSVPSPKLVPGPKPGPRPGTPSSRPGTPASTPSTPSSRPGVPGSRPGASTSSSNYSSSPSPGLDTPGSRPGVPGSRPGASAAGPGSPSSSPRAPASTYGLDTPGSRPGVPGSRYQANSITLPISPDGLQTFAIDTGKVSFMGRDKGYIYRGIVFRGDTRAPETIFKEGFKLRTKINDINEINGFRGGFGGGKDALDPDGKGISTSGFYKKDGAGAYYYGGNKGGYTYIVDGNDMEGYHLYQNRHLIEHPNDTDIIMQPLEINYGKDIPSSNIIGAFDKNSHFIKNPNYRGKFRIPPNQGHHHHYSESHAPQPQALPKPHSESESESESQPQPQDQGVSLHQHKIPTFGPENPRGWTGQPFEEETDHPFLDTFDS